MRDIITETNKASVKRALKSVKPMEWIARISGDNDDLHDLSKVCNSDDISINEEEGEYVLSSTSFNRLTESTDVYNRAKEIMELINGAVTINLGSRKNIEVQDVVHIDSQGNKIYHNILSAALTLPSIRLEMRITKADGTTTEINQASPIPPWIKVAEQNESVAKALRMLSNKNYDWPSHFYHIFEVIQSDVGNISKNGWTSAKSIDRFTQTVNSLQALGDLARHGNPKWEPPKKPMDFGEAKSFIHNIVTGWINSYIG